MIEAHVQIRQPEYGMACVPNWEQGAIYRYICERMDVYVSSTPAECPECADRWEIDAYEKDRESIRDLIAEIRERPDVLKSHMRGTESEATKDACCECLADLLEEGLDACGEHGYTQIVIDWF